MIVTDDRVAAFVAKTCGIDFLPPWTCMGIESEGEIIAGVVFHCFEGANVHLTIAGHGWTRGFLRAVGEYIFETLKCERFTLTTEQPAVVNLGVRLGGQVEGLMRNQFGRGRDGFLIGVLKDEYRFR
ncbi:GNAT family N-acetyltransferase [Ensifer sp. SL37]|uniref:GNAT family N-acetyltransferase n=1 Tax=Ensifer sp. SL37 TaxID=2995137 RepID=UPI002273762A|nr:N-acetyltransferase [Ensifer sp. SL37]MCY1741156.1 N-acetyltransferase [Ensifer sp. SL37]